MRQRSAHGLRRCVVQLERWCQSCHSLQYFSVGRYLYSYGNRYQRLYRHSIGRSVGQLTYAKASASRILSPSPQRLAFFAIFYLAGIHQSGIAQAAVTHLCIALRPPVYFFAPKVTRFPLNRYLCRQDNAIQICSRYVGVAPSYRSHGAIAMFGVCSPAIADVPT